VRGFVQEPFTLRNLSASTRCFITAQREGWHSTSSSSFYGLSAHTHTHTTLRAVEINSVWNLFCAPPTYIQRAPLRTQTRPLAPIESAPTHTRDTTQHRTQKSQKAFCAAAHRGGDSHPARWCWQKTTNWFCLESTTTIIYKSILKSAAWSYFISHLICILNGKDTAENEMEYFFWPRFVFRERL
jgi:hypothetical protein